MKSNYKIVERYKAEKILRFATFLIDYIIIISLNYFIGTLIGLLYYATESEFIYQIILALNDKLMAYAISIVILLTYYNALEYFTKGRTIGKFVTGTMVVNEKGGLPTSNDFLKRNFSRIVPFDAFSFLGNNGWHDSWSDTKVVKRKSYLEALERENSIEDIGQIASEY